MIVYREAAATSLGQCRAVFRHRDQRPLFDILLPTVAILAPLQGCKTHELAERISSPTRPCLCRLAFSSWSSCSGPLGMSRRSDWRTRQPSALASLLTLGWTSCPRCDVRHKTSCQERASRVAASVKGAQSLIKRNQNLGRGFLSVTAMRGRDFSIGTLRPRFRRGLFPAAEEKARQGGGKKATADHAARLRRNLTNSSNVTRCMCGHVLIVHAGVKLREVSAQAPVSSAAYGSLGPALPAKCRKTAAPCAPHASLRRFVIEN